MNNYLTKLSRLALLSLRRAQTCVFVLDVYNLLLRLCHRRQTTGRVDLLAKPTTTTELAEKSYNTPARECSEATRKMSKMNGMSHLFCVELANCGWWSHS